MRELLQYLIDTLQSQRAAADYLGYSRRQFFNIRKKVEDGATLHPRVETHILQKVIQLKNETTAPMGLTPSARRPHYSD